MGDKEKKIENQKAKKQENLAEDVKKIENEPEEEKEIKEEDKSNLNEEKQEAIDEEIKNDQIKDDEVKDEEIEEVKEENKDGKDSKENKENKTEEKEEIETQPIENVKEGATYIKGKKNKKIVPIIVSTVLICVILLFSVIFALVNINNDKIMSGISIMGIDVSELGKEEATKKLQELTENKASEDISLKYGEFETAINGNQFNISYDVEKAVAQAYNIGRDGNIIVNNYSILFAKLFKRNIDIQINYDEELLNSKLQDVSAKLPGAVKQSNYYIEDENLIIVKGKAGLKIKEAEIKENIFKQLENILNKNEIITIPVETVEADSIDVSKIKEEIYKEPQDAYVYKKSIQQLYPHVNGVDFEISMEEAQKITRRK